MIVVAALLVGLSSATAQSASAVDRGAVERQFQRWLEGEAWPRARERGVSRATFETAVRGLDLDWSLPELEPPGMRRPRPDVQHQPEFRSAERYLSEEQFAPLIRIGREQMRQWARTLNAIEQRFGVPKEIIMSIWGRETAFGRARIPHNAVRVLATSAFMGARREFFFPELLALLKIIEAGHARPGDLRSSWAGALGHPQFLPSKYLKHAVDFDGDGHADIWDSIPDALASIAAYLHDHGWRPGLSWGFEVNVPHSISCAFEGPHQGRPIGEWADLGVTRPGGAALARSDRNTTAYLLKPAGRMGPAFLVSDNFYVLKDYNESDAYAVFVGHLADRLANGARIVGGWSQVSGLDRGDIRRMQERLVAEGYDVGGVDGLVGFRTRVAIGRWQERNGLTPSCFPDRALLSRLE